MLNLALQLAKVAALLLASYAFVFVFFIITVAAAEVAVGLALIVALYRRRGSVKSDELVTLRD